MIKYLIFIFCDKPSTKVEEIMDMIRLISDSPKSNYLMSDKSNSIVIHFSSNVEINDLKEYVYISLVQYSKFFFMTECNDKVLITMSPENLEHLINLGDNMSDINYLTHRDTIDDLSEMEDEDDGDEDSDIMALKLMSTVKKNCKLPTLNEILDKISEEGIESLTQLEKEILNTYSKN